jgi:hypothetical protein
MNDFAVNLKQIRVPRGLLCVGVTRQIDAEE